jgi:hypothetical protein
MCERHSTSVPLSPRGVTVPQGVKSLRRLVVWANKQAMRGHGWGRRFAHVQTEPGQGQQGQGGQGGQVHKQVQKPGQRQRQGQEPGQGRERADSWFRAGAAGWDRGKLRPLAELNDFRKLYNSGQRGEGAPDGRVIEMANHHCCKHTQTLGWLVRGLTCRSRHYCWLLTSSSSRYDTKSDRISRVALSC